MAGAVETKIVKLGGTATVDLPGAGTSGYEWQPVSPASVSVRRADSVSAVGAGIGAAGHDVFEVTPGRRGKSVIVFKLRRPWEPRAVRQRRIEVIAQ